MFSLIESEVAKDSHQNAARILNTLLEACVDKVDSLVSVQVERLNKIAKEKETENDFTDFSVIEKSRSLLGPCYATERVEDCMGGKYTQRDHGVILMIVYRLSQPASHSVACFSRPCLRIEKVRCPYP